MRSGLKITAAVICTVLSVAILAGWALMIAQYYVSEQAQEESSSVLRETDSPAAPVGMILTDTGVYRLFLEANRLYLGWLDEGLAVETDGTAAPGENGRTYRRVTSKAYSSLQDLQKAFASFFSPETCKRLDSLYLETDGVLYRRQGTAVGGVKPLSARLQVTAKDANTCTLVVESDFGGSRKPEQTEYTLEYLDGNWVFTGSFQGSLWFYNEVQ